MFFASQKCTRGESCTFGHSAEEVQPQPDWHRRQLCRSFMQTGLCTNGEGCHHAHGRDDLRRTITCLNSGYDALQQPEHSYRRYGGDCSSDADENDALRRSQRMGAYPSMACFDQRSACRTTAGSSSGLATGSNGFNGVNRNLRSPIYNAGSPKDSGGFNAVTLNPSNPMYNAGSPALAAATATSEELATQEFVQQRNYQQLYRHSGARFCVPRAQTAQMHAKQAPSIPYGSVLAPRFCIYCGQKMQQEHVFCPFCGARAPEGNAYPESIDDERALRIPVLHDPRRIQAVLRQNNHS